jgi:predicted MFS family arabinose efflux permease
MSLFSMFFFISLYLQQVLGYNALKTGLSYLPLAVAIILSAGVASQLVNRLGYKPPLIAGMLMVAGSIYWFSHVSVGGSYVGDVLFPSLIVGVGLGFSFVPVTIAAVAGTRPDEAGLASGLINTAQQVGGALGLAILAAIANSRTAHVIAGGEHNHAAALTSGFRTAFLVGSAFALVAALLAGLMISSASMRGRHVKGSWKP